MQNTWLSWHQAAEIRAGGLSRCGQWNGAWKMCGVGGGEVGKWCHKQRYHHITSLTQVDIEFSLLIFMACGMKCPCDRPELCAHGLNKKKEKRKRSVRCLLWEFFLICPAIYSIENSVLSCVPKHHSFIMHFTAVAITSYQVYLIILLKCNHDNDIMLTWQILFGIFIYFYCTLLWFC